MLHNKIFTRENQSLQLNRWGAKLLSAVLVIYGSCAYANVLDAEFELGTDVAGNQTGGDNLDLKISHSIVTTTGDEVSVIALGSYKAGHHTFKVSSSGVGARSGGAFNIHIHNDQVSLLSAVGSVTKMNGLAQIEFLSMIKSEGCHFLFLKWVPQSGIQSTDENKIAITHISASGRINDYGDLSYSGQPTQITYSSAQGTDVYCNDGSTALRYLMYSAEDVTTRFAFPSTFPNRAKHFIAVRYDAANDRWWFDNNNSTKNVFIPQSTDVLLAELSFDNGTRTVQLYNGVFDFFHGIRRGYLSGDLSVLPDTVSDGNGGTSQDNKEFYIQGSQINLIPMPSVILKPAFEVNVDDSGVKSVSIAEPQGDISMGAFGTGN